MAKSPTERCVELEKLVAVLTERLDALEKRVDGSEEAVQEVPVLREKHVNLKASFDKWTNWVLAVGALIIGTMILAVLGIKK